MKQELSSSQASPIVWDRPSPVYDALARSLLAYEYENVFLGATGLTVQLMPGGVTAWHFPFPGRGNPFCSLMAKFAGSCAACQQAHTELQRQVADNLAPQVISCFAGLTEFAVPIVVSGQHAATLFGGQVFQRNPTAALFARLTQRLQSWEMHQELPRLETAFFQTRVTLPKQLQASVQLLAIFAKFLAEDVNRDLLAARTQDAASISIAKNFILAHASEPLHLSDIAEHVHVSTNYFSKFFKKATGMGFSEFLARVRVENAKNKLADPMLPINEVADQVGFGSLSQFNRAFHRYAGCSPREFRATLLQQHSF
jgi:AraC-like DNA-binding protein/ligand-binding sensor protein